MIGEAIRDALAVAAERSPDCPSCGVWMLHEDHGDCPEPERCDRFYCPDCDD